MVPGLPVTGRVAGLNHSPKSAQRSQTEPVNPSTAPNTAPSTEVSHPRVAAGGGGGFFHSRVQEAHTESKPREVRPVWPGRGHHPTPPRLPKKAAVQGSRANPPESGEVEAEPRDPAVKGCKDNRSPDRGGAGRASLEAPPNQPVPVCLPSHQPASRGVRPRWAPVVAGLWCVGTDQLSFTKSPLTNTDGTPGNHDY